MTPDTGRQTPKQESDPQQSPLETALLTAAEARRTIDLARQTLAENTLVTNRALRQFLDTLLGSIEDWFISDTAITLDKKTGMLTIKGLPMSQERPNPVNVLAACENAGYIVTHSPTSIVFDLTIPLAEFERLGSIEIGTDDKAVTDEPDRLRTATGQAAMEMATA